MSTPNSISLESFSNTIDYNELIRVEPADLTITTQKSIFHPAKDPTFSRSCENIQKASFKKYVIKEANQHQVESSNNHLYEGDFCIFFFI